MHTYTLTQFLCQNLCSSFSCPSSTLPITTAALRLLERLQNPLTNISKSETIIKKVLLHASKNKSATLFLFQTAFVAVSSVFCVFNAQAGKLFLLYMRLEMWLGPKCKVIYINGSNPRIWGSLQSRVLIQKGLMETPTCHTSVLSRLLRHLKVKRC